MPFSFLDVSRISFVRDGKAVLKNISFSLSTGRKLVIAGETGSGKSSLLKIIGGLEQPSDGTVWLDGEKVKGAAEQLVAGHPHIAYLSQHFELPKFLRVEQVLEYANQLSSSGADKIFSICRINHLLKRKTDALSGGEKQRIAIARLLIQQPHLLLLDEPYSHLDMPLKNILKKVVEEIGRKLKISCVLVSHDPDDTLPWADEIIVLKHGQIVQRGNPKEIYKNPRNEYVAGLFGNYTVLDSKWTKKFGIKTSQKEIILRPENFAFVKKGSKTVSGTVVGMQYYGHHTFYEVETGGKEIFVPASGDSYSLNGKVKIKII